VKADDLTAAKQKAYRLLSMRPHSEKELKKKLREKGFSEKVISETLNDLRALQYLDDNSFARQSARNFAANKLWGDKKIVFSLREKGLDKALIDDALREARREISEETAVERLIKKKTAEKQIDAISHKEKQKIFQSLLGRGFPSGLILRKLGKVEQGEEDRDEG